MTTHILAGDIGGTKTNLGIFACDAARGLFLVAENTYASAAATSAVELITRFLADWGEGAISAACLGYAGPIINGEAQGINLPWPISEAVLSRQLRIPKVLLLNDLAALAAAVPHLPADAMVELHPGRRDPSGNIAVLAAGTGLGEALLVRHNGCALPIASEGGNKDLAPKNELEFRLCAFLQHLHGHASVERVLSGRGLLDLYCFLLAEHHHEPPAWLPPALASINAAEISRRGQDGSDSLCRQALDLFVSFYAAEAGNLALQYLATGGVYIGGGIGPQIRRELCSPAFRQAFLDRGRMRPLLSSIPVCLILDPKAPVLGAARYAADHLISR